MDPSSPAGSEPRRPDEPAPDTTGEQAYDGYDGRYSRAGGGATSVLSRPERPASGPAEPVAPTRRRRAVSGPDDVTRDRSSGKAGPFGARRVGIGILVGAFLMFAVASLDSLLGAEVPVLGSFASPGVPRTPEPPPLPPPPDTPGTCLDWDRADATDTTAVDCAQPHLFEQAGRVALADQPVFPSDAAWQQLVAERCTPVATSYLQGRLDPNGKFRVGALKPSEARWTEGDKGMRCGLQMASRSGAMLPITGKVAAQDQSAVQPAGTCLAIDGRSVGDPTDCAGPHAVEAVEVVDLGTEFPQDWPAVEDQDKFLQPTCTEAANRFAGNDRVIGEKGLTVYWNNMSEESWNAGSRKINCNVAALLPDGSGFATVTGSVKGGNVVVGERAAPPAPGAPGAPAAPGAPGSSAPAPAEGGAPAPAEQPGSGPATSEQPGSEQDGSEPSDPAEPSAPGTPSAPPSLDVPPGLPGLGE